MLGSKSDISTIDKITFDDFVDMVNNQKWDHEYDSETSGPIADYYDIPSFNHTCNDYLMHNPMKKATLSGYSESLSMNSVRLMSTACISSAISPTSTVCLKRLLSKMKPLTDGSSMGLL